MNRKYKVLDVREYESVTNGNYRNSYGGGGGNVNLSSKHYIVAICINIETNKRVRHTFYEGYEDKFLGKNVYYGYTGDFNLIVPGDLIEIKETSTYKRVEILMEE